MKSGLTYKAAGVDIDAGDESVKRIGRLAKTTFNENVIREIGLFGAFYRLNCHGMKQPVLVSSVDGVGTKLKIAFMAGIHDTVGEDLVNHCVNDIMTSGATPLFFLDYLAISQLSVDVVEQIVTGMARGCRNAGCALIGGETAEMPGFYRSGEYDISGTMVGIVDAEEIIDGSKIQRGDILIGLPSNGLHTNGYSLVRKIFFELNQFKIDDYIEELTTTLGQELLRIHRSYQVAILALKDQPFLHGMSHITGGGIEGNTNRILPPQLALRIDWESWPRLEIFHLIQHIGQISEQEMRRVFNLGIGFIFIVDKNYVDGAVETLGKLNEKCYVIGEVI
ncbi:MAG: phosphoribosylformylglycinamidine cyclo-ligase [candidate division KSB1 bacterium]|nr:phosphoribosylformylglycinamidine cyclo-ligase [candidate division KSB1 bacterium]MDZ7335212.1 phosphoribosylformylglycinamidine cyclo-ligase [candidate division KSB1 bacterium]MDZ7357289.1 phosphoribosylformylglycinamidine cyclo-ligase [candidate division KSB1 bacterium]MDZ7375242.1 phosphoribosylformylglycinamidine cyclo-ligase [candidate division KSB1 bacterium]MDZ7401433.1 phosphoribosylformylglycinamidine cyclo-ligase [candidate division KSB1 bacterium]